jgi:TonB family protein
MRKSWTLLVTLVLLAASLVFTPAARAQFSKLSDSTAEFAKKLQKEKPHRIAVADFTASDGSPSDQGDYFASCVTSSLTYHVKKLPVADHDAFQSSLAKQKLAPHDLDSPEGLRRLGAHINVDFVIIGSIDDGPGIYTIRIIAHKVADASTVIEKTIVLQRTEFTDSLSKAFPPPTDYPVLKALPPASAMGGAQMPTCLYCPTPSYNDQARQSKVQGTVILEVLISSQGQVVRAHPIKLLGRGLDERAFDEIKGWRFKPALNSDGTPVAMIVPIEVTFRLY